MKNGQYLSETVILISIIIAAIIGMQTYVRRSVQANVKREVDLGVNLAHQNITGLYLPGNIYTASANQPVVSQYEPYYNNETLGFQVKHASRENATSGGVVTSEPQPGKLRQDSYYTSNVTSQSKSYFDTSSDVVWQK